MIDGRWRSASGARSGPIYNPATGSRIGDLRFVETAELDAALLAARKGFDVWKRVPAFERYKTLRRAADLVRDRAEDIAGRITREQGKPLAESRMEAAGAADHIDWYAEECRRSYGRIIPSRAANVSQWVVKEPVGPVAAFTPWNFPVGQLVRKIAGALAAGCSIIVKPPEDTPSSCIALCRAFQDAGLPAGALNVVFGVPHEISEYLLASDIIKKLSFTGSVPVGRRLAALAGQGLKRVTLELGGHAPFIVTNDADGRAGRANGRRPQVPQRRAGLRRSDPLLRPVRCLRGVHGAVRRADRGNQAGRRLRRDDAHGAAHQRQARDGDERVHAGCDRRGRQAGAWRRGSTGGGFFYQPTIITDLPPSAKLMREEPFGPVATVNRFDAIDEAIAAANSLPFALAAFAFCRSAADCALLAKEIEAGMISINGFGLAAPETPFGGIKDSGYGSEGGTEGLEAYLSVKFVSQAN
ncbi:MAG: aldehyde dehydrogenase family protein [Sphingomonas sp.]